MYAFEATMSQLYGFFFGIWSDYNSINESQLTLVGHFLLTFYCYFCGIVQQCLSCLRSLFFPNVPNFCFIPFEKKKDRLWRKNRKINPSSPCIGKHINGIYLKKRIKTAKERDCKCNTRGTMYRCGHQSKLRCQLWRRRELWQPVFRHVRWPFSLLRSRVASHERYTIEPARPCKGSRLHPQ